MKQPLCCTTLLTAALLGAGLFLMPAAKAQGINHDLEVTETYIKQLQAQLDAAQQAMDRKKALYAAGQLTQGDVTDSTSQVQLLQLQLAQATKDGDALSFRARLQRPVDIQMDHASVQQFAQALSKATDVPVRVDKSVPADASTMLTIDAQQVPLSSVLEAIAQKADLMIAPDGKGVVLKKWPHLNSRVYRSPNAPWSTDWGIAPTTSNSLLGALGYTTQNNHLSATYGFGKDTASKNLTDTTTRNLFGAQPKGSSAITRKGYTTAQDLLAGSSSTAAQDYLTLSSGLQGRSPGFTMTNLGDRLIAIAEPGKNAQGEAGVWLTAYKFDGAQFKKISSIFHPFLATEKRSTTTGSSLRR